MPPIAVSERDRRALVLIGVAVAVFSAVYFWPEKKADGPRTAFSAPQAEKRLDRMNRQAAALPAREEMLKKAMQELARREKGVIAAETPAKAEARLLEIVRRVARAQQPPLVLRSGEFHQVRPLGGAYGEATVTVQIDAGIEQILNFLADLGNQPELLNIGSVAFSQVTTKQKLVPMRLMVGGVVSRSLVPRKEGKL